MFSFLIFSPLLDDPPIIRIFLLLSFLLVLGDEAVPAATTNYLFLAIVVAEDAELFVLDLLYLPHLASIALVCQSHNRRTIKLSLPSDAFIYLIARDNQALSLLEATRVLFILGWLLFLFEQLLL